ncbi:uncharacterized protein ColSpa_04514 [Colletotrichum spaethianum]|uniref:Uncharacterized protein n=1 Tax=Colletotrichum spaethianum TaxID=700344 RepID=A0AA37P118_9PEZI|nr:uncharacterized protein ColSpa_04514 [Colletotrichum spaethianum]GKT44333.1 hypothetical protein ColSpa_04514 [Colletotrichum spaethianum]
MAMMNEKTDADARTQFIKFMARLDPPSDTDDPRLLDDIFHHIVSRDGGEAWLLNFLAPLSKPNPAVSHDFWLVWM